MSQSKFALSNYLVPVNGRTSCYMFRRTLPGLAFAPAVISFRQIKMEDGDDFTPYGFYADNTQGTQPLTIQIQEIYYSIIVPIGARMSGSYPGVLDQVVHLTGEGDVTVLFVNYPVI